LASSSPAGGSHPRSCPGSRATLLRKRSIRSSLVSVSAGSNITMPWG
jgi:hypothetical protein